MRPVKHLLVNMNPGYWNIRYAARYAWEWVWCRLRDITPSLRDAVSATTALIFIVFALLLVTAWVTEVIRLAVGIARSLGYIVLRLVSSFGRFLLRLAFLIGYIALRLGCFFGYVVYCVAFFIFRAVSFLLLPFLLYESLHTSRKSARTSTEVSSETLPVAGYICTSINVIYTPPMEVLRVALPDQPATTCRNVADAPNYYVQAATVGWGVEEEVIRARGMVIERLIVKAREVIHPDIGSSPALALTFTTLDPRTIEFYFEYVHVAVQTPEVLDQLQARETCESLLGILKISTCFFDTVARRYALARLDLREDFIPTLRMTTSIEYRIPEWFDQAVDAVLLVPLYLFTAQVHRCADPELMAHISTIKHKVMRHRLLFITDPPVTDDCRLCANSNCCARWIMMWNEFAVPIIADHFDLPILKDEMKDIESALKAHKDCCDRCFRVNMELFRGMHADNERAMEAAVTSWRNSVEFYSVEAAMEGIRRRSDRGSRYGRGIALEANLSLLSSCSGLGAYSA